MWQNDILRDFSFKLDLQRREESINAALSALLPLTSPVSTKYLFWPIDENWTLYFDNGVDGTDAAPPQVLSSRLRTDAIRVVMSDQLTDPSTRQVTSFGATILEYYCEGNNRRTVYASNDGGSWKFGQYGEPFGFENRDDYTSKSKKDRFTHSLLLKYLNELGVSLDTGVSLPKAKGVGYLLTKHGKMPVTYREHDF
ncbi:hypothetical protein ADU59_22625 [Pararhizobium polonicum]|uniref:Uncharacterized protein n=1 Tax=Pararhizobium polonicum TaxID=1612624 RepID=A0A1C7NX50_9HYPH|nr:hypothetical protein [Pararhizobium polonicum]OBZ93256.1 hypothetical protein ADU59_22625 [Pararhizobium polonicum]